MKSVNCTMCVFFDPVDGANLHDGFCMCNAPTPVLATAGDDDVDIDWPPTSSVYVCREFEMSLAADGADVRERFAARLAARNADKSAKQGDTSEAFIEVMKLADAVIKLLMDDLGVRETVLTRERIERAKDEPSMSIINEHGSKNDLRLVRNPKP